MRKIKFRVWDNVLKFYPKDNFTIDTKGNVYLSTRPRIIKLLKKWNVDIEKRDEYITEQYTGLVDCKGNEIYEGDIVQQYIYDKFEIELLYEVKHLDYRIQFVGIDNNNQFDIYGFREWNLNTKQRLEYDNDMIPVIEVIGNIHSERNDRRVQDEEIY